MLYQVEQNSAEMILVKKILRFVQKKLTLHGEDQVGV